jgi:hypothetical protein
MAIGTAKAGIGICVNPNHAELMKERHEKT